MTLTLREQWRALPTSHRGVVVAFSLAVLVVILLVWRLNAAHGAEARAALAESQARARADTTRALRDSLGFQRLVVQQTQRSDATDVQLGEIRRALLNLAVVVATRETRNVPASSATTENAAGERHATFDARAEPFTVHAAVTLPAPPAKGWLDTLRVSMDSIALTARLGCTTKVNALGMRDAMLTVQAPPWAAVGIGHVEQAVDVCPSPVLQRDQSKDDRSRVALVAGYGYTYPSPAARGFVGIAIAKPLPCPKFLRGKVPGC